ncbi:putative DNA-damage-repair/toleration protein DRT100 [Iris pallida]|uniref:DNA-damage-repair/toleration protein DRT100 n=1 Tax=Iris pallida TaxID=29817 RepID=A0AAX6GBM5_IRIPA|nr:putative DNA-damage-repair/toleration protein DRT100 [Iris pallida]
MAPLLAPLFLLLLLLSATSSSSSGSSCSPSDRAALLSVRSSLVDPYLSLFSSWNSSNPDCCRSWYGVACDPSTGRVVDLSLRGESTDPILTRFGRSSGGLMSGSLSPSLCALSSLTSLVIADWKQISGPIPSCLPSSLRSLRHLDLVGNRLTGPIPPDVGAMSSLRVLNLADNLLTGPIPSSLSARLLDLRHLDLSNNRLTGPLPWDLGSLRMLSRALLSRNQLSGPLPPSLSDLNRLADLDLSSNQLSGAIPAAYGSMPVLSTLNLDCNRLSGPIPATLLASRGIGILNLSRNALEGAVPDVFGQRSYFMVLDLSHNSLSGRLPATLRSAAYIGHLDLSHNRLCGPIPAGSPFDHLEAASFADNDCLCGAPLPKPCRAAGEQQLG